MKTMMLDNNHILNILKSEDIQNDDFGLILRLLKEFSFKAYVKNDEDTLIQIFNELVVTSNYNENKKSVSKLLEKYANYLDNDEYNSNLNEINNLIDHESKEFKDVIRESFEFNLENKLIGFNVENLNIGLRNAKSINELKEVLLTLALRHNEIEGFMNDIYIILDSLIFDEDIVESIEKLNDGFENRKNEIIYHLYCIAMEIPEIIKDNITAYRDIGPRITIPCSPERKRYEGLKKYIDGHSINCELHTKMRRISAKAPDRIYFCPQLPQNVFEDEDRGIFIYKITKHIG